MPNGHGGFVRFGSSVFLLILLAVAYAYHLKSGAQWIVWAGYGLAGMFGWRFAYHLHMWSVSEYGGAYASEDEWTRAFIKYLIGSVVYGALAMTAWYFVT